MDRRLFIGAAGMAALLVGRPAAAAPVRVVVFGDSYSQVPRAGFPNWVTQLESAGRIRSLRNLAKGGATAATVGSNHLARQLRLWRQAGRPVGDRVIVFLGFNDIEDTDSLQASYAGYKKGLAELKAAGARLLLVEPIDVGKVPRYFGDEDSALLSRKSRDWSRFVRARGLPVVRLLDVFKPRLPNPALFHDDTHLNRKGHAIIANAVAARLT